MDLPRVDPSSKEIMSWSRKCGVASAVVRAGRLVYSDIREAARMIAVSAPPMRLAWPKPHAVSSALRKDHVEKRP